MGWFPPLIASAVAIPLFCHGFVGCGWRLHPIPHWPNGKAQRDSRWWYPLPCFFIAAWKTVRYVNGKLELESVSWLQQLWPLCSWMRKKDSLLYIWSFFFFFFFRLPNATIIHIHHAVHHKRGYIWSYTSYDSHSPQEWILYFSMGSYFFISACNW